MQANSMTSFVQQSQSVVQVILGLQSAYSGLRKSMGEVGKRTIFCLASVPVIWWLSSMRRKHLKSFAKDLNLSLDNYSQLRRDYDSLHKNWEKLLFIQDLDSGHMRWPQRSMVNQVKAINKLHGLRLKKIEDALKNLDPVPTSSDGTIRPLKENELWSLRARAYDYLM